MKTWYITFGQDHIHFIRGHRIDKDCIVLIRAEEYDEMRKKAFAYFGNSFYTDYEMTQFNSRRDKRFFPRGIIDFENTIGNDFQPMKIKLADLIMQIDKKQAIARPMYKTDPDFKKGMDCLIEEETGIVLTKHFDRGKLNLDKFRNTYNIKILTWCEIDWDLAGYPGENEKKKEKCR